MVMPGLMGGAGIYFMLYHLPHLGLEAYMGPTLKSSYVGVYFMITAFCVSPLHAHFYGKMTSFSDKMWVLMVFFPTGLMMYFLACIFLSGSSGGEVATVVTALNDGLTCASLISEEKVIVAGVGSGWVMGLLKSGWNTLHLLSTGGGANFTSVPIMCSLGGLEMMSLPEKLSTLSSTYSWLVSVPHPLSDSPHTQLLPSYPTGILSLYLGYMNYLFGEWVTFWSNKEDNKTYSENAEITLMALNLATINMGPAPLDNYYGLIPYHTPLYQGEESPNWKLILTYPWNMTHADRHHAIGLFILNTYLSSTVWILADWQYQQETNKFYNSYRRISALNALFWATLPEPLEHHGPKAKMAKGYVPPKVSAAWCNKVNLAYSHLLAAQKEADVVVGFALQRYGLGNVEETFIPPRGDLTKFQFLNTRCQGLDFIYDGGHGHPSAFSPEHITTSYHLPLWEVFLEREIQNAHLEVYYGCEELMNPDQPGPSKG